MLTGCTVLDRANAHLPFAVLRFPLELDVPVLGVYFGAVGDGHSHWAEEVQARRTVRHFWAQENFTAFQCLDTKHTMTGKKQHTHTKMVNVLHRKNI